ncbi:MAG: hypothetical protein NE328_09570 [Lentisphaeraceae bacterium]|nr:hypothetical protein [Lentisphaeraceae bacterium]
MNSTDYILSLCALNKWLESLENKADSNIEDRKTIHEVSECFNNVFNKFSEIYKDETGMEPPDNFCEVMLYNKGVRDKGSTHLLFKREVTLPQDVITLVRQLVAKNEYIKLKSPFEFVGYSGQIYLNIEEAEALIELAIIEQKKALLKYPNYDRSLESYSSEHEMQILDIQQGLYDKVVLSVTKVFKEFDKTCLI